MTSVVSRFGSIDEIRYLSIPSTLSSSLMSCRKFWSVDFWVEETAGITLMAYGNNTEFDLLVSSIEGTVHPITNCIIYNSTHWHGAGHTFNQVLEKEKYGIWNE